MWLAGREEREGGSWFGDGEKAKTAKNTKNDGGKLLLIVCVSILPPSNLLAKMCAVISNTYDIVQ
jgi:hypothetical protein